MSILLDAIVVLLVVLLIVWSAKKGFTVSFLRLIGRIAVIVAAWFAAWGIAVWLYDAFLRNLLIEHVGSEISTNVLGGIGRAVSQALSSLPDVLVNGMKGLGLTPETITPQVETMMTEQGGTAASAIVDVAVAPIVVLLLRVVIFLLLFVLGLILLRVITRGASMIVNLPLVRQADVFFGAILGVVNAAIVLFLITTVAAFLIPLCGDSLPLLNTETIEGSVIFRFLYHLNPLTAPGTL